ncbi:MAG: VWA domain-containing protein [Kiloniellales bacterium]|nr:VWA domain-containing protein [Kiloniellales bacterium]
MSLGRTREKPISKFLRQERGSAMGLVAVSLLTLAAASGLALDAGRAYLIKAKLSQAVDAAALAGGRALSEGSSEAAKVQIEKYFQANFPDGYLGVSLSQAKIDLAQSGNEMSFSAAVNVPTTLLSAFNIPGYEVSASATVSKTLRSLEIAMVIDNSKAMGGNRMKQVRKETREFLDTLFKGKDSSKDFNVAVVPFTARANVKGQALVHPDSPPDGNLICMDIRPGIHAVGEANPTEEPFDHYSGVYSKKKNPLGYEARICPQANVLPLSRNRADIDNALDGMKGKGCRRFDLGAAWGWRALSPSWQNHWQGASATPPADYDQSGVTKAMVLLTHGKNTDKKCSGDPEEVEETEKMFLHLCDEMKREGVLIYTIAVDVPETISGDEDVDVKPNKSKSELSRDIFEDCASGSSRAFFPGKMKEVAEALSVIAGDLSVVRLTR